MYQYKREPLSDEELTKLVNSADAPQEKLVVYVLADTGLRVSELAKLTKQNIYWQERKIIIYGKGGPYGKKTKRRIVPLTDRAYTILSKWFALNDNIMSSRNIQYIIRKVGNKAGITKKLSPHVLRHTFAVNCIKSGISTRALQMFLGHDLLATTEIYLNLSPEDALREFHNKFNKR